MNVPALVHARSPRPAAVAAFVCALAFSTMACAHLTAAEVSRAAGFDQRLSSTVPGELAFRDEAGRGVHLSDYDDAAPIILAFAWYGCTTLCPTVIGNLAQALGRSGLPHGAYQVIVASIDPRDAPADALRMKGSIPGDARVDAAAWHLLTGNEAAIAALTQAAGFRYAYDDETHQYAHPAGIVLLTPQRTIARYFEGFDFTPVALRQAVDAAAASEIASPAAQLLLLCFHFAPSGRYSALVLDTLRVAGGGLIIAALALVVARRRRSVAG